MAVLTTSYIKQYIIADWWSDSRKGGDMMDVTEADPVDYPERFAFGLNWDRFVERHFSHDRVKAAREKLLRALRLDSLEGLSFIDIGCGSGLHSLAALQAGAAQVFSFDYDQNSVATTLRVKEMHGKPVNWVVAQASVLDHVFMTKLEKADIVYSWGCLHHTGNMWKAIENARIPLKPNGVLFIALYSHTVYADSSVLNGDPLPEQWLKIKKRYNSMGQTRKRLCELSYVFNQEIRRHSWNPKRILRNAVIWYHQYNNYSQSRGMDYWTDIRDWLGGWPMEFVKERELFLFARDRLDLELLDCITGAGNTEFLFRSAGCANYWDAILGQRVQRDLSPPFVNQGGLMWSVSIPDLSEQADTNEIPGRSRVTLFENGLPLSYAHAQHEAIQKSGGGGDFRMGGAPSHTFSTSDNTDPNTNGRKYHISYEDNA